MPREQVSGNSNLLKVQVTEEDHIQGDQNAAITLVEYGDYQCPSCGEAFPIIKLIQKHFGKKLKFVFRNFPLTELHHYAEVAAETAEFANAYNKFWEIHDLIYKHQNELGLPLLFKLIKKAKLSEETLQSDLQNGTYKGKIKRDFLSGIYSGVNSTPSFFINNRKHTGSYAYEDLVEAIEQQVGWA